MDWTQIAIPVLLLLGLVPLAVFAGDLVARMFVDASEPAPERRVKR